jgi:hypothetical protein
MTVCARFLCERLLDGGTLNFAATNAGMTCSELSAFLREVQRLHFYQTARARSTRAWASSSESAELFDGTP